MPNPAPHAKPILAQDGWRKHAGDFYTRPLDLDVRGLLGLAPNRGLPHQWRLQPYVGVIHERVNALARALTGSSGASRYPHATIRYKLVRLLDGPEAQERDRWLIAAEAHDRNERVFHEVADAVREVGLPWMQKRTSLDAMIYELRDGNGPSRRTPYLTAALWMQGKVAAAETWLAQIDSQFGAPPPEIPAPLRGLRVTSFGSSAPPRAGRAMISMPSRRDCVRAWRSTPKVRPRTGVLNRPEDPCGCSGSFSRTVSRSSGLPLAPVQLPTPREPRSLAAAGKPGAPV